MPCADKELRYKTMNKKYIWQGLLYCLGVAAYVVAIASLLANGNALFGEPKGVRGPVLMLMLLCLSAAVVGSLVFGRPAYLVLGGQKSEGIKLLFANIGWLAILTIIALATVAINR